MKTSPSLLRKSICLSCDTDSWPQEVRVIPSQPFVHHCTIESTYYFSILVELPFFYCCNNYPHFGTLPCPRPFPILLVLVFWCGYGHIYSSWLLVIPKSCMWGTWWSIELEWVINTCSDSSDSISIFLFLLETSGKHSSYLHSAAAKWIPYSL